MASVEAPSFNSNRIQRAYRINNIENAKLEGKLNLLEKEKIHRIRVTNQDIRLISVTLDYINASSGYSPEGLSPDSEVVEEERQNTGAPCFLYGERIVSRKKRRFQQRPFSAMERSSSRRSMNSLTDRSSVSSDTQRPQSSPSKTRAFVTSLRDSDCDEDDLSYPSENSSFISSEAISGEILSSDKMADVTKKLLRAKADAEAGKNQKRVNLYQKVRSHSVHNINDSMRQLRTSNARNEQRSTKSSADDRNMSTVLSKNSGLMDILNQRRPTLNASAWKTQLNNSKMSAVPMTVAAQRQQIMDIKLNINEDRKDRINDRVKSFINFQ